MCLIIFKKSGLQLPDKDTLERAFKNNPDGFGVAFYDIGESHVHIKKGAMTIDEMHKLLAEVKHPAQKVMLLHFRQATAGKVAPANTHPYPFSNKDEDLAALDITTKVAIAHNGIIFSEHEHWGTNWGAQPTALQTDTAIFIKKELFGIGRALFNQKVASLIGGYTNSKFIFLSPKSVMTVGEFINEDGILYSNRSSMWTVVTSTTTPITPQKPYLSWDKTAIGKAWIRSGGTMTCSICDETCWAVYDLEGYEVCRDCFKLLNSHAEIPYKDDELETATQTDDSNEEEDEEGWDTHNKIKFDTSKWEISASGQLVRKVIHYKGTKDIESHVDKMDKAMRHHKGEGREELQHSLMTLPPETP